MKVLYPTPNHIQNVFFILDCSGGGFQDILSDKANRSRKKKVVFSPLFRAKKCLALLRGTSKFSQKTPTHHPNLGDVSVPVVTLEKMDGANLGTLQHTFLVCLFALANKLRETHKKQNAYV